MLGLEQPGQIGDASTTDRASTVAVLGVSGITAIAAGYTHTCALVNSGAVKCWGNNFYGNLGTGDTTNRSAPANVVGLAGAASSVTPGGYHTCARVSAGVQCWGLNANGQLGAGNTTTTVFPQNTVGLFGVAPPATGTVSPVTSNYPVYTWKAVSGTAGYRLRVNGVITTYTPDQANCPLGTGLCTVTGPYLAPGAYSWQVQPYNSYGDAPWSALTQFSI